MTYSFKNFKMGCWRLVSNSKVSSPLLIVSQLQTPRPSSSRRAGLHCRSPSSRVIHLSFTQVALREIFFLLCPACKSLHQLLDSLLDLQDTLSSRWRGGDDDTGNETQKMASDEEVCSDSEEESEPRGVKIPVATSGSNKRKRRSSWPLSGERRDYEGVISRQHEELRAHRHSVLSKWDEKTRMATGKITSKVSDYEIKVPHKSASLFFPFLGFHGSRSLHLVSN